MFKWGSMDQCQHLGTGPYIKTTQEINKKNPYVHRFTYLTTVPCKFITPGRKDL